MGRTKGTVLVEAVRLLETRMAFDVLLIDLRVTALERRAVIEMAGYLDPAPRIIFMGSAAPADLAFGRILIKPFSTVALGAALYPR